MFIMYFHQQCALQVKTNDTTLLPPKKMKKFIPHILAVFGMENKSLHGLREQRKAVAMDTNAFGEGT